MGRRSPQCLLTERREKPGGQFGLVAGKEVSRHSCYLLESSLLPSGCELCLERSVLCLAELWSLLLERKWRKGDSG